MEFVKQWFKSEPRKSYYAKQKPVVIVKLQILIQ